MNGTSNAIAIQFADGILIQANDEAQQQWTFDIRPYEVEELKAALQYIADRGGKLLKYRGHDVSTDSSDTDLEGLARKLHTNHNQPRESRAERLHRLMMGKTRMTARILELTSTETWTLLDPAPAVADLIAIIACIPRPWEGTLRCGKLAIAIGPFVSSYKGIRRNQHRALRDQRRRGGSSGATSAGKAGLAFAQLTVFLDTRCWRLWTHLAEVSEELLEHPILGEAFDEAFFSSIRSTFADVADNDPRQRRQLIFEMAEDLVERYKAATSHLAARRRRS